MADTPRVTVPVEPIQRLILAADSYGVRYLDSDDMSDEAEELQAATEAMKDLIAAPAPEGVVDVPSSWSTRYQGIATREEAPAAGELKADFTRSHPSGLDDSTYEQIEDALDRADAPVNGPDGKFLTLAQSVEALRAQPQARGDAQPVAWRLRPNDGLTYDWAIVQSDPNKTAKVPADLYDVQPLYVHPAPDTLRVAVEALTVARSQAERGADKAGCDGWRSQEMCRQVVPLIDQALAALQAEQGAK